jgi:hypothetical protein
MSKHKINWLRSGTRDGMDWETEHEITFEFRAGRPEVRTLRNGDPGYPADPDEIELVSITPGPGDHGVFTDLAQRDLEGWAQEWLETDGFDEAISIVADDGESAREYAADLRADR